MKKEKILIISLAMAILVNFGLTSKAVWAASEQAAICRKTDSKITVDGDLKDWGKAVPAYVTKFTSHIEKGEVKDDSDFSMVFYTLYDDENFYFAALVIDDDVITKNTGADIWQDDCIEIWLDDAHDSTTPVMFAEDDYQIGFSPQSDGRKSTESYVWRNPDPEPVMKSMKVASSLTGKGYIIEASIPIKVLNELDPKSQKVIGFNISVCDVDKDGAWTHIVWSGKLHSDPRQFGELYFVTQPPSLP